MEGIEFAKAFRYFDKRTNEEDMPIIVENSVQDKYEKMEELFENFFDENCLSLAKQNSKEERDKRGLNDSSYVYGEITFRSLSYIIEYIKATFGENSINDNEFVDLGSGIARGVIAATFLYPFKKCSGIEYLEQLHSIAVDIKEKFDIKFEEIFKTHQQEYFSSYTTIPEIELINGDFLKNSWEDATFLLANSTCFSADLMVSIAKKADEELPSGAIFVTFTKRLPNLGDKWELKDGFRRLMSWGIATVYIHRKK